MTVQLLPISFALNVLQHVIHLFLLRYRVSACWLANRPGVALIDHVVYFLCAPLVTALCFKDVLTVANELIQCLRFSETHVWSGISYHFFQLFAELLLPSWLRLLIIDGSGPLFWLSMSYNGAFTQNLVPIGHIHGADWYSAWLGPAFWLYALCLGNSSG